VYRVNQRSNMRRCYVDYKSDERKKRTAMALLDSCHTLPSSQKRSRVERPPPINTDDANSASIQSEFSTPIVQNDAYRLLLRWDAALALALSLLDAE
jgi:hypothetical protein